MRKLFKKLKGFTLIELLAVIIILAIIALIATPLIISIINDSRQSAALESARGYVKAVNYKIMEEEMKGNITPEGEYIIGENELLVSANNIDDITGEYLIGNSGVTWAGLCVNHFSIGYYNGKAFLDKAANYCNEEEPYVFTEPDAEFVSALCSNPDLYDTVNKLKIKTVEDIVCLSNLVNSGKNFSGKEVYLLSDINFSNDSSYKNKSVKDYGDINEDGVVDDLKTEVTTGKGFKPIGGLDKPFSGTFTGYAFTISNLMINRPEESYIGLFGNAAGAITGLKLRNANVIGNDYVSLIAATYGYGNYNDGPGLKNLDIQGSVTGNNYVAGLVGKGESYTRTQDVIFTGSVTGNNYVAALMGGSGNSSNSTNGLIYNTTITATGGNYINVGSPAGDTVFVKNVTTSPNITFTTEEIVYTADEMALFDSVLDTYIGGDTNGDKYYFDFDGNGVITVFSTDRKPITTGKLKGTGTEDNPYLIRNTNDWKSATATIDGDSHYYSIINDIDFTGKTFYPLGTKNNVLKGVVNGNGHTISNLTINGYDNVGVIGKSIADISNMRFNNITINGISNYVGIFSDNNGLIEGIKVRNANVTGYDNVGIIAGTFNYGNYNSGSGFRNLDVQGTVSGRNYVAGLVGYGGTYTRATDFIFTGSVTGNNYVATVMGGGGNNSNSSQGLIYNTTLTATGGSYINIGSPYSDNVAINNVTVSPSVALTDEEKPYTSNSMALFDSVVDTYIGGDTNKDGYYFDLNENGILTLYTLEERPINVTLTGEGTQSDPYVINNADDWKMATATIDENSYYYSINNDIDFTGKVFYPLGTKNNVLKGKILGNHHTISNVIINGYDNVGVFGKSNVDASDLVFNNITINGISNYVGIFGENVGALRGIKVRNTTVTGYDKVGVLAGTNSYGNYNSGPGLTSIDVQGTATGHNYISGIVGYGGSYTRIIDTVFKGSVTGSNYVAAFMSGGNNGSNSTRGVVYDTTITATDGNYVNIGSPYGDTMYIKNVTTSPSISLSSEETEFTSVTLDAVNSVIDTTIGGDNGGDGYYFTLTNGEYELVTAN